MKNPLAEVNWGLFGRRTFAFVIDFLLFVSVFTVLIRAFNFVVPGSDVREDAMQLYTQKDFNVFMATAGSATLLLCLYLLRSYHSARGQTLGHRVAGVRIIRASGERLRGMDTLRIVLTACLRLFMLFVPGPLLAFMGGQLIGSIFLLVWGLAIILPIPIRSNLTIWEWIGGYRFELVSKGPSA